MSTQYRWSGSGATGPGEWREFRTLAVLDAVEGGGTGKADEIELRVIGSVSVTAAVVDRWQHTTTEFVRECHRLGLPFRAGVEEFHVQPDGAAMLICPCGPGLSCVMLRASLCHLIRNRFESL